VNGRNPFPDEADGAVLDSELEKPAALPFERLLEGGVNGRAPCAEAPEFIEPRLPKLLVS
jgi:hypothetical protein